MEKEARLKELQRRLDILNAPRKDGGGDCLNPDHMNWLTDRPLKKQ